MNAQWYYFTSGRELAVTDEPPKESRAFLLATEWLQPSRLAELHRGFQAWGMASRSPGLVTPDRIWLFPDGGVSFRFARGEQPAVQSAVGAHAGLAAWLVLLDKYVETSVVLTSARAVWSAVELVGALAFATPALLPAPLLALPPNNWERTARALARVVANGATTNGAYPDTSLAPPRQT